MKHTTRFCLMLFAVVVVLGLVAGPASAQAADKKPNIVIIWGDDIGQTDISAYSMGLMGFRTPNIDRVAKEGVIFTDFYAEQSCTAGRSSFITGQCGLRTGNTKVGMPGAALGIQARDVTIAQLLKSQGYATGQFGKNHLGDLDEHLPTNHGFDEFYGPLYHLNASEEPEQRDYPKDPDFLKKFGPRGVIHSFALPDGTQKIEDTGPLTKKRMETIDDDIAARSAAFIEAQHKAGKPVFVWVNFTHMHFRTHAKPESLGQSGRWQSEYHDVMIDHDKNVGTVLAKLDELGMADDTIVMYSTDNGPHMNSWPDAAMTPFRSEKNSNWEGAYRVPAMVRWPGHIKPGMVANDIVSHLDFLPTLLAAAGVPDVKEQLLKGMKVGDKTFKVHLDGYNLLPYLTGQEKQVRATSSSTSTTTATWSRCATTTGRSSSPNSGPQGTMRIWSEPFTPLRVPKIFNLRTDPYERADITSNTYYDWLLDHAFVFVPAQAVVGQFLARSRNSRRARNRPASASTRSWTSCSEGATVTPLAPL